MSESPTSNNGTSAPTAPTASDPTARTPTDQRATSLPGLSRTTRANKATLEALATIEESFGGRPEVIGQLASIEDPAARKMVQLMTDPRRATDSLLSIAADANVAPVVVLNLLRDAAVSKALAGAQLRMATRLGNVVDRVMDAAEGSLRSCDCTIGGTMNPDPNCPKCRGTGQQFQKPSLEHQRMVFEATELLKRPGGPTVNVNQGVQVNAPGQAVDFFDRMVKGLGRLSAAPRVLPQPVALRDSAEDSRQSESESTEPDVPDGQVIDADESR